MNRKEKSVVSHIFVDINSLIVNCSRLDRIIKTCVEEIEQELVAFSFYGIMRKLLSVLGNAK